MVHLSTVHEQSGEHQPTVENKTKVVAELSELEDTHKTPIYGSRTAALELPRDTLPDDSMPNQTAFRMIKDELNLDGNPALNLASFVTTYMEDEAETLMQESLSKNFIDYEEYPKTVDMQNRCVSMIGKLFHAPEKAIGVSTVGSSEAIMLAVLAMKRIWKNKRKAEGKSTENPNIIMSSAVQVCWEKAARYFEIEEKFVYCSPDRFVLDIEETVKLVDENTVGICAILGTTYTGDYEDIKGLNDLLISKGMDTPIHVDAASGGFVAPFVVPSLQWDFRCERVVSINVSGHKYGLVYPGVGWVLWRDSKYLPQELVFNINYLGADQASFTLNFSKGAAHIVAQYYQLIRLGRKGYCAVMSNLTRVSDHLAASLASLGFVIMSEGGGNSLPLVAFRFPDNGKRLNLPNSNLKNKGANDELPSKRDYDEFSLARQLRSRGWIVPAYTMAPHTENLKLLRVVVREDFTRNRCADLINDIKLCCGVLDQLDAESVERIKDFSAEFQATKSLKRHPSFSDNHSLQGKTGKTHGIC
jgi:glutamate decarboxylase